MLQQPVIIPAKDLIFIRLENVFKMAAGLLADMTDDFLFFRISERYAMEISSEAVTNDTTQEYAWCLVRSPKVNDMRDGLDLLKSLLSENPGETTEFRKRCYCDLAIGHARLKEFPESFQAIIKLRQLDPSDLKWQELETAVEKKVNSEAIKGGLTIGAVVAVVGSAVGFAFRLLR